MRCRPCVWSRPSIAGSTGAALVLASGAKGALAWWLWGAVHVLFLIDGRSRAGVVVEWLWDYLTLRRGTRLITGERPKD